MKTFLLVIFSIAVSSAMAQPWMPVRMGASTYFKDLDFLRATRIDSTEISLDGTLILYNYPSLTAHYEGYGFDEGCCGYNPTEQSWLSTKTCLKGDSLAIFETVSGDSVFIFYNKNTGDSWPLYTLENGDYIEVMINEVIETEILPGLTDSLKVFSLLVKNAAGDVIPDYRNGKTFSISKQYGLVEALKFSFFPDVSSLMLVGMDDPDIGERNLTAKEIYDFEIGDEFHTLEWYVPSQTIRIFKVIDKVISPSMDSVSYTFDFCSATFQFGETDTFRTAYIYDVTYDFNDMTNPINLPPDYYFRYDAQMGTDFRMYLPLTIAQFRKKVIGYPQWACDDQCVNDAIATVCYTQYIEGYGDFTYESCDWSITSSKEMVYAKKGDITWGIPYTCEGTLSVQPLLISSFLSIYPNPANEKVTCHLNLPDYQEVTLEIYSITGQLVLAQNLTGTETAIDITGMPQGYYTSVLKQKNQPMAYAPLIIQQ